MAEKETFVKLGDKTEGLVRFSFPAVFKPKVATNEAGEAKGEPKYSVCVLIDKKYKKMIASIEKAVDAAIEKGVKDGTLTLVKGKRPNTWKLPLRDGDDEREGPEYEGMYFLNCSSKGKPGVIDRKGEEIAEDDVEGFYAGCYGRVTINFFPFNKSGGVGVAAGLGNLQKIKDGPRLAGRTSAAEDFNDSEDWDDEDEETDEL